MMGFICYYGHVQNTSNLGQNIFTSNFLGALVEVAFNPQNNVGFQSYLGSMLVHTLYNKQGREKMDTLGSFWGLRIVWRPFQSGCRKVDMI